MVTELDEPTILPVKPSAVKDVISLRNFDLFATLLTESWKTNKRIHESTTNEEVEKLISITSPYFSGMKLLGAGGGGYALFASASERDAEALRKVLETSDLNPRARIVDFAMSTEGLKVTVS